MTSKQAKPRSWGVAGAGPAARAGLHVLAVLLAVTLAWPGSAHAQTTTSAQLRGVVRSVDRNALADTRVILEETATGFRRSVRSDRDGEFVFRLVPPGEYSVIAERLGYQPQLLAGVRLLPGRSASVTLVIAPAEPPVFTIDTVEYAGRIEWSRAGASRWFGDLELDAPRDRDLDSNLASLATQTPVAREGMPFAAVRSAPDAFSLSLDPAGAAAARLSSAELVEHLTDVQWEGGITPMMLGWQAQGGRSWTTRAWSSGSDAQATLGRFSDDEAYAYDRLRGGAEVSGPLVQDTAVFLIGGEWRRSVTVEPRAWRLDELAGAEVDAAAREASFGLLGLTMPRVAEQDEIAAWGRLDWRVATDHDVSAFADFRMTRGEPVPALRATPRSLVPDRMQAVAGATLRSIITSRFSNELRLGFARTTEDGALPDDLTLSGFNGSGIPYTSVVAGSLSFGANPFAPSTSERTALRLEQALMIDIGSHALKLGLAVDWDAYDFEHGFARTGAFTFGDAAGFAARRGGFLQTTGPAPVSSFSVLETGGFLQDTWRPADGVELTAGVRFTDERLPTDGIQTNAQWASLTGVSNAPSDERIRQISPRFGLMWNVGNRGSWIVRAGFGLYHDDVDPALIAERQVFDGSVMARRLYGDLGAWPVAPAGGTSTRLITLFGPEFRPPRATRASLGVSRIGPLSVHVSGVYRHTDFLPARRDLNRAAAASAEDQYGRPIFGELVQQGALLAPVPGSNRRFGGFDVVSAIESTAWSDYWGITAIVERRVSRILRVAASYTFSDARDNWIAQPGVVAFDATTPQLGDSASGSAWAEGRSSYDIPHSVSVTAELALPLPLSPTLGVAYRGSSGLPFTPGFQPGVDVNGDYAANDPAFVDGALDGMAPLLEEWECLREQTGVFAERNSCRGDAVHALDARLGFELGFGGAGRARVYVDALNLLGRELAVPDGALYLIDPNGETTNVDGVVTMPLVVNPRFGLPVRPVEAGRVFRVGVEVGF